ncbi:MAG: hypothetical protein ACXACP_07100 [Candidatus Hodarchaeales archaeon]
MFIFRMRFLTELIITPDIRLEWITDALILLVFIGLAVMVELVSYFTTGHESGSIKAVKHLKEKVNL